MSMMSDALKGLGEKNEGASASPMPTEVDSATSTVVFNVTSLNTLQDATQIPSATNDANAPQLFSSLIQPITTDSVSPSAAVQANAMTLTPKPFVGDTLSDYTPPAPRSTESSGPPPSSVKTIRTERQTEAAGTAAKPHESENQTRAWDPGTDTKVPVDDQTKPTMPEDPLPLTTADVISQVVQRVQDNAAQKSANSETAVASSEAVAAVAPVPTIGATEIHDEGAKSYSPPTGERTLATPKSLSTLETLGAAVDADMADPYEVHNTPNINSAGDQAPAEVDVPADNLSAPSSKVLPAVSDSKTAATTINPSASERTPFEARVEANLRQPLIHEQYEQLAVQLLSRQTENENGIALIAPDNAKPLVAVIGHLAWCIADNQKRPRNVLLVDADVRGRFLSRYFNADEVEGLSEACDLQNTWQDYSLATSNDRIRILPAGGLVGRPELKTETVTEILDANKKSDTTVLIFGGAVGNASACVCQACENAFLVVTLGQSSREHSQHAVESIQSSGGTLRGCIVTDVPPGA